MKIAGIVAEYNPFHSGHAYQISETKRLAGDDCGVVCVMSGNYSQRGSPAVFEKHARAAAAVSCGADLVIELPVPYALSSAEEFASRAVELLLSLGCVTTLSFGSECGNPERLHQIAEILLSRDFPPLLKESLCSGCAFPVGRQKAAETLAGEMLPELSAPNDILGIEYIKACLLQKAGFDVIAVKRVGASHDRTGEGSVRSAAEIRKLLRNGTSVNMFVPAEACRIYDHEVSEGRGPVDEAFSDEMMLSRLRMLSLENISSCPDISEGLEHRLYRCIREARSMDELFELLKTKRYTMSRLRRLVLCAVLGITSEAQHAGPAYLRVLASSHRGLEILKLAKTTANLPLVTNAAQIRALNAEALGMFCLESASTDFYTLAFPSVSARNCDMDWRAPLYILSNH